MLRALSVGLLLAGLPLSNAVNVYLYPPQTFLHPSLSPEDASSVLSRHLGLEIFEPLRDTSHGGIGEELFVGMGSSSALLLTMDEAVAKDVLPQSLQYSFILSTPPSEPISSLSSVISTYLHRASHTYSSIFDFNSRPHMQEVQSLDSFLTSSEESAFAAIELKSLSQLRMSHGHLSAEYTTAAAEARAFLERAIDQLDGFRLAVLTFSPNVLHSYSKRQSVSHESLSSQQTQSPFPPNRPPPQEPIGSVSACFTTLDACTNGTNTCSGRGQCVEASKSGRTCFVCTCGVTKTGEGSQVKTDRWVGQSCERKDVSGPFVLLTGTVIAMIILVFGSISLLYSVGDHELPSTLLGTVVNGRRD